MRRLALAAVLPLSACVDVPPPTCEDLDGDGWSCATSEPDCNEDGERGGAGIHPGANEVCDNGIDEDCSGDDLPCTDALVGLSVSDDYQRMQASGDGFAVEIERSFGYTISSLRQSSSERLLDNADLLRGVGVALPPDFAQWQAESVTIEDFADGPALSHRWYEWRLADQSFGFSYVTIFPDGRIHRHDRVDVHPASAPDAASFSTYASFADSYELVYWPTLSEPIPLSLPLHREGPVGEAGWLCAVDVNTSARAALLWVTDPAYPAAPTIDAVDGRLTLAYDWLRGVTSVPPGTYRATTMLIGTSSSDPETRCVFDAESAQLQAPAPLILHAGAPYDSDDIVDGYDVEQGIYAVDALAGDHVEFELGEGGVPGPGFAISVVMSPPTAAVWRDGVRLEAGRDYLSHYTDWSFSPRLYFYFRGPVEAGARFWISAPGGEP